MIIVDRLGKKVLVNNKIAIAQVGLNSNLNYVSKLVFATVKGINKKSLSIEYEDNSIDNDFTNDQFVILPSDIINLMTYQSLEKQLEQHIYTTGFVNV